MNTEEIVKRKRRPNGKKRDAISLISLALMLIVVLYVFSCRLNGSLPFVFNRAVVRITTGSMEPFIPTDSYIVVRRVSAREAKELQVDQIITFTVRSGDIKGQLNTHRIVGVDENGCYITQGDYNGKRDDDVVAPEDVLGVWVKNAEGLTEAYLAVKENSTAVIVSAAVLIAAYFVICTASDIMQKKHGNAKAIAENAVERLKKDEQMKDELERRVKEELERLRAKAQSSSEDNENK